MISSVTQQLKLLYEKHIGKHANPEPHIGWIPRLRVSQSVWTVDQCPWDRLCYWAHQRKLSSYNDAESAQAKEDNRKLELLPHFNAHCFLPGGRIYADGPLKARLHRRGLLHPCCRASHLLFLPPLVGLEPTTLRLTAACSTDWAKEDHIFFRFTSGKKINPCPFIGVKTDFVFLQWCHGCEFYLHPQIHHCKWWIRGEKQEISLDIYGKRAFRNDS